MLEAKHVTREEMSVLLAQSKQQEHPYYYRFSFHPRSKRLMAVRIKKGMLQKGIGSRAFHSVMAESSTSLSSAVTRLHKAKDKLGVFSNVG